MRNLKRVFSLALALVMVLGMMVIGSSAATYPDADEITYNEAIDVLSGLGILEGDDNGYMNPTDVLTREQAAKIMAYIMLGATNAEKLGNNTQIFKDVPAGKWSAGYIAYCANVGLIAGVGDGNYNPTGKLTGTAFAKMLLTAAGYDAEVEGYVNDKDWAANVAVDAMNVGIDVEGVALEDEVTREQAAQMVLQALEIDTVRYVTGNVVGKIGPYTVERKTGTDYTNASEETNGTQQFVEKYFPTVRKVSGGMDVWGNPVDYTWKQGVKDLHKEVLAPVATYTTEVKVCQVVKDLGLKTTKTAVYYDNGVADPDTIILNYYDTVTTLAGTDTGVLTQIYKLDNGTYVVTQKDTYLAKVSYVIPTVTDANGHVTDPTTGVFVYNAGETDGTAGNPLTYKTEAFAKDTYVLVNIADGNIVEMAAASTTTAKQTAYNLYTEVSTIGDVNYNWSANYYLNVPGNTNTVYNVYTDGYGNVIGLTVPNTAYTYGIITDIAFANSYMPLDTALTYANIKTFANTDNNGVVMGKIMGNDFYNVDDDAKIVTVGDPATGAVSAVKASNAAYYNTAYKFTTEGGKQVIKAVGTAAYGNIINSVPSILVANVATNDNTVYLVKTGNPATGYVYTTYTGYKTVPSMQNVNISYFDNGVYATYVFVDATSAIFPGNTQLAYITDGVNEGMIGNMYKHYMYIDGVATVKYSAKEDLAVDYKGLYTVSYDTNGYVVNVTPKDTTAITAVAYTGTVITDVSGQAYNCTGAVLYELTATGLKAGNSVNLLKAGMNNAQLVFGTGAQANVVVAIYYNW